MTTGTIRIVCAATLLLLFSLPAVVQAQYSYTNDNGAITITRYAGSETVVIIPSKINGLPVTSIVIPNSVAAIGDGAFGNCSGLTSVTIGNGVTRIGYKAFAGCYGLTSLRIPSTVTDIGSSAFYSCATLKAVYFQGNAPIAGFNVFESANNAAVYYLPGTTGWGPTFGGRPAVLWNPQVQTSDASFGVQANQFGFTFTGTSGLVIVVEACTNLVNPVWSALGTTTLTGGSSYFSDPQWTNYPTRLYRLRSP